ncbi:hypothetical protein BWX42_00665 [Dolosigranulum pigrum]|uniref:Uncharacterized protein n=1 Tax=Dolosigranulum pigrum TaxID=29394 RepID=A0A1S8KLE5_9LACT|nr:hypothetical protein BWX42_00285 [Dolosigranulum pigrum]OOL80497.1 hypothetical protein BWX42_00665 [Dolosigranulum pigrum]
MKIINIEQIKLLLDNEAISAYSIEKESKISRQTITSIRRGDTTLEKVPLNTLIALQSFLNDHPLSISYDYDQIIEELKHDKAYDIDDPLFVLRKKETLPATDHHPIIDYTSKTYPLHNFIKECEETFGDMSDYYFEFKNSDDLLEEMEDMNKII